METNEYFYRTCLTRANKLKDHRVRIAWHSGLDSAIEYLEDKNVSFDIFLACDLSFEDKLLLEQLKVALFF